ncbi:MAG: 4Fe-4S dicluster domain-containing protein [Candidatus Kariarchaeaceae archaeon]
MSTIKVIPGLLSKLSAYGAGDISLCYNCGNCSATCILTDSTPGSYFPRKLIRYAELGLESQLVGSKELWQCIHCGDCSVTCPRQAEPAEFMAATRRYAISKFEVTGFAGLLYRSKIASLLTMFILGIFAFIFFETDSVEKDDQIIGASVSFELIHTLGLILAGFVALSVLLSLLRMFFFIRKEQSLSLKKSVPKQNFFRRWFVGSLKTVFTEISVQSRFNKCEEDKDQFFLFRPWLVHLTIFWGMIGMFLATGLNWAFKGEHALFFDINGIDLITRTLGIVGGLLALFGVSAALIHRIKKTSKAYETTYFSDWLFLVLLFIAILSGFFVTILAIFEDSSYFFDFVLIVHIVFAAELLFLAPFTKFAHGVYRPFALWVHNGVNPREINETRGDNL